MKNIKFKIPGKIIETVKLLEAGGFETFLVGGCVRDLLLGLKPKDWDITTNARPEEIQNIFPENVYKNDFGTVSVKIENGEKDDTILKERNQEGIRRKKEKCEIIEVTTYRTESCYLDKRHPDKIEFAESLQEDLSRRDFTINAMALKIIKIKENLNDFCELDPDQCEIIDFFQGRKDLENKVIRSVGVAEKRFNEDALRMMRAIRFIVQLGKNEKAEENGERKKIEKQTDWKIEEKTFQAIQKNAINLKYISPERIQEELNKIILSEQPAKGIRFLDELGLLEYIIPELLEGKGLAQAHHHYYGPYREVFDHAVAALEKCPSEKLETRLASLLHDIGKPKTARGKGKEVTFYNHEYVGARLAEKILTRLKYPRQIVDKVTLLVENHMFYYNVDEVREASVRRLIKKVGMENINDLIDVRISDRLGSGVPKAVPYKLRHFRYMVEKVSHDPISVAQLEINGKDIIGELQIAPGSKIGAILEILLAEVIEKPSLNQKKILIQRAKKLVQENLENLRKMAQKNIGREKEKKDEMIKKRYWVK